MNVQNHDLTVWVCFAFLKSVYCVHCSEGVRVSILRVLKIFAPLGFQFLRVLNNLQPL